MAAQPNLFDLQQPPKVDDICANRHRGARQSVLANERVQESKAPMRERIRLFIAGCQWQGATLAEICAAFGKLPNQLSGRFTELKKAAVIFDSGRVRDHHAVYVVRKEWVNGQA